MFVSNRFMSCEKLGSFLVLIEEVLVSVLGLMISLHYCSLFFFIVRRIIRIMFILKYYLILNIVFSKIYTVFLIANNYFRFN